MNATRIKLEEFQISPRSNCLSSKLADDGEVKIMQMDDINLEIDFIGFHTSLINAFRRIILSEVSTMAIEKVIMYNNTSIVQDEVLAHRLGLVPLKANHKFFAEHNSEADLSQWGPQETIKYELKVKCTKNSQFADDKSSLLDVKYKNRKVLSSCLKWIPIGNQTDIFSEKCMGPLHEDILLAKLNPGHLIHLEAFAVKGVGQNHAKFQPGLAWYRMLPEITLNRPVEDEDAELLQKCFSPGVITLHENKKGKVLAKVSDARNDSCSRNVFHYKQLQDAVSLERKTDHIIFYVESHSALKSYEILEESIKVMIGKCEHLLQELEFCQFPDDDHT